MRIKDLRKEAGLTQKQLAEQLNVKQNTVSYWEQGKTTPDSNTICQIADYFHVTVNYVLGLEEEKPNPRIVAQNLRYLMNQYNKQASEVCTDLGFDNSKFDRWLTGLEFPDNNSFEKLQDYFWASPTFLLCDHHFDNDSIPDTTQSQDALDFTDVNTMKNIVRLINHSFHSSILRIVDRAHDMGVISAEAIDIHDFDKTQTINSLESMYIRFIANNAFSNAIKSNNAEFLNFCYDDLSSIPVNLELTLSKKIGSLLYKQINNKPE